MTNPLVPITSQESNAQHKNADVDTSSVALHHTLGISANQSSPGNHIHDGRNSKSLGKGFNVSFPTTANASYNQAQIQALIDARAAFDEEFRQMHARIPACAGMTG